MTLDDVQQLARAKEPCVLVTLIASRGSSPRHVGSVMLVRRDGGQYGTIGGGEGEAQALDLARQALRERRSRLCGIRRYGVSVKGGEPMCGGDNRLLIEYIAEPSWYALASERVLAGESPWLVKSLATLPGLTLEEGVTVGAYLQAEDGAVIASAIGSAGCAGSPADPAQLAAAGVAQPWFDEGELRYYHPLRAREQLLILGAGHVGQALARSAQALGLAISVADDRAAYLAEADLPASVTRLAGGFSQAIDAYAFTPATYVVVATRSHALDFECGSRVLKRPHRYVGLVGSAAKTRLLIENLRRDGVDSAAIEGLYAPIGVDIGSETPQEIAIAIMAEIIACRHGRILPTSLRQQDRRKLKAGPAAALVHEPCCMPR